MMTEDHEYSGIPQSVVGFCGALREPRAEASAAGTAIRVQSWRIAVCLLPVRSTLLVVQRRAGQCAAILCAPQRIKWYTINADCDLFD